MVSDEGPVPLRLPAILQNPTNHALRQVEAHNAQQREKAGARRAAQRSSPSISGQSNNRGKRVLRRINNAAFAGNPHVTAPTRDDLGPSVPLHSRPLRPSFPTGALERSAALPSANLPFKDPHAPSSIHGTFSTSLKGMRAILRRRGRHAERIVSVVEDAVRAWLGGDFGLAMKSDEDKILSWRLIDSTLVENSLQIQDAIGPAAGPSTFSRRMPAQLQVLQALPLLPETDNRIPAILELSRSPAHLSWFAIEPFDRLVIHLIARYYDLISWSENRETVSGQQVRLTHLARPTFIRPQHPTPGDMLLTPETSDASDATHSDLTDFGSSDSASDTATEVGDIQDYDSELDERQSLDSLPAADDASFHPAESLDTRLANLELHRTTSVSSSAYASSEGDGSEYAALAESVEFPSVWTQGQLPLTCEYEERGYHSAHRHLRTLPRRLAEADGSDKPSFFEYLFGA